MTDKALIAFLSDGASYPHPTTGIVHRETHISDVFLTGELVYKIKKPIRLEFLDFSTIALRQRYCERERELNSRFAPDLYLDLVPIYRDGSDFTFSPTGEAVEYCLRMKQFDEADLFSNLSANGKLTDQLIIDAVDSISKFHRTAKAAPGFWSEEDVWREFSANMEGCTEHLKGESERERVRALTETVRNELDAQRHLIVARQGTHVRQLHGDLHFRNICVYNGAPLLFDGIEFNDRLSCCDTWADFAFFLMELIYRDETRQFYLALNRYLERSDDFNGLPLLRLYLCYRASVRAKVALLHGIDQTAEIQQADEREAIRYLELSEHALEKRELRVVAIGGLSGTGKSTLAQALANELGYLHIRSDAVRKHTLNLPLDLPAPETAYSAEQSTQTYLQLFARAEQALDAGWSVIVDGVFLDLEHRERISKIAESRVLKFDGLWCHADRNTVIDRISLRKGDVSDATVSVFNAQEQKDPGVIDWDRVSTDGPLADLLPDLNMRLRRR